MRCDLLIVVYEFHFSKLTKWHHLKKIGPASIYDANPFVDRLPCVCVCVCV